MKKVIISLIILLGSFPILASDLLDTIPTKTVNLSEFGYPVRLYCTVPVEAEVIKEYDSYSIKINGTLSIWSITWHNKNYRNFDSRSRDIRTQATILNDIKKTGNYKVVEEYENGFYGVHSNGFWVGGPILIFCFESDEHIYEVQCGSPYAYKDEDLKLLMEIINSIEPIDYCYDEVEKIRYTDYIHDFSETGFAFKIALPKETKIEPNWVGYKDYNIVFAEGQFITVSQYHLANELDIDLPKQKLELQNDPDFARMIEEDPNGYLLALYSSTGSDLRYKLYYYHRTLCYFYRFEATWSGDIGNDSILGLMNECYIRVQGAQVGKVCE